MLKSFFFILIILICSHAIAQTIGSKVGFKGTDGRAYTGTINAIRGNQYKIKYDGFEYEAWAAADQFTLISANTNTTNVEGVGSKVSFGAVDGKHYTGIVKAIENGQYRISYDGMNFEAWLTRDQFSFTNTTTTYTPVVVEQPINNQRNLRNNTGLSDLKNIFEFGRSKGWTSPLQENKFNAYLARLTPPHVKALMDILNRANTSSARFFVLKSLLNGDDFPILETFIDELNAHSESYQQERCLVTTHHSIIQQWEYSCSVTVVQTYLGDLCPRYAWGLKVESDFDKASVNPYTNSIALQQKELLEKYGGAASVRGDLSGKYIPINDALNDFVGKLLNVHFSTQQVTEPLTTVFAKVRNQLDKGMDTPLLIGFVGSQARHFILVMNYKYAQGGYQYLIYDPWDGLCDYVSESNILQGSMAPLLTSWRISVDYYYIAD